MKRLEFEFLLFFFALTSLAVMHCSGEANLSNGFGDSGSTDDSEGADCERYCIKKRECDLDLFETYYENLKKCNENCEQAKETTNFLICAFKCDTSTPCRDWLVCEMDCYGEPGGGACDGYDSDSVYRGGYEIEDKNSQDELSSYVCITGDLEIDASVLSELSLPNLEAVGGNVRIPNTPLESVDLSSLKKVGKSLHIYSNGSLESIDLSSLRVVMEFINIFQNRALKILNMDSLEKSNYKLDIHSNNVLTTIEMNSLIEIDGNGMEVHSNASLQNINMSGLESVSGGLQIYNNPTLPTCEATWIRDQLVKKEGVCIRDNLADNCDDDTAGCN
ncbi:MAG: hypothetical protein GY847_02550 [Proteobacteria bacterium]|nr:hypothetical protein [Pseudomonadota bacterium]